MLSTSCSGNGGSRAGGQMVAAVQELRHEEPMEPLSGDVVDGRTPDERAIAERATDDSVLVGEDERVVVADTQEVQRLERVYDQQVSSLDHCLIHKAKLPHCPICLHSQMKERPHFRGVFRRELEA